MDFSRLQGLSAWITKKIFRLFAILIHFMNQMNEQDTDTVGKIESAVKNDELAQCKTQAQEYLNGWQRAKADFVNYKNDEARRLEDTARFMTRSLLQDLLPLLDSFDLAIRSFGAGKTTSETEQEKGILLIHSQLMDILKKRGFEQIIIHLGESFNPEKHEALGEVESEFASGSVAEEIQKGYILAGNVIRPARVRVGK